MLADDFYDGQTIDARLVSDAWLRPGFSDDSWSGVTALDFDVDLLVEYVSPPVVRHEEVRPVEIWQSPAGRTLIDFGQNLVGWLKFSVRGERGDTITLRHAEVLENGELGVRPLRTAKATDELILSGGEDFFEPTLTFHGFRYAEVTGWPGELTADSLVAVVISSDLERIGHFECSDPMLNQLHSNVVWGQRGNFLDVPTDCPQRDERLGWTGDLAVFAPTAAFLFDSNGFLRDWLRDLDAEQRADDGMVGHVIPNVLKFLPPSTKFGGQDSTSFWSDAAVWVPWAAWQAYGDRDALAEAFPAMVAHVSRVEGKLSDQGLWDTGSNSPTGSTRRPPRTTRPQRRPTRAWCPRRRSTAAARRWRRSPASSGGMPRPSTSGPRCARTHGVQPALRDRRGPSAQRCPTVYALAIAFGLLDEPQRQFAGDRLAELVAENGYRVATGFAGTPYICDALTATGHLDAAYRLLLERSAPRGSTR